MSFFRKKKPQAGTPTPSPSGSAFDATRWGMVSFQDVAVDDALGDTELAAAIEAVKAGDWKPAAQAVAASGADWDRRMLRVSVLGDVAFDAERMTLRPWLQDWQAAEPESPHAAVVEAQALMCLAGHARGAARARATSREQFENFHRLARQSDESALRAIELAPADPTPWATRMMAALGRQTPNDEFTRMWDALFARAPLHRRGHSYAHTYWLAKWFGSEERSAAFVADAVARAPRSPLAFELSVHRMQEAWVAVREQTKESHRDFCRGAGRPLLDEALAQWDGRIPTGGTYEIVDRNLLAWALVQAERHDEAFDVFRAVGGSVCKGFPWLYYQDARAAFTAFRREAIENSSRPPLR